MFVVNGCRVILDKINDLLRKTLILKSEEHYDALTLWIAHTYAISSFDFTPRLAVWSPEKRCGKSLLLEIVSHLVDKPRMSSSISCSALFRMISKDESTVFLIDETDALFGNRGDKEKAEAIRQIINSGFKRGASVWRCEGTSFEPKEFNTFAPLALAGIGTKAIPETVADRSLVIEMRRKYPNEEILEFQSDEVETLFSPLKESLASWIEVIRPELREVKPIPPKELNSRAKDVWKSLLKIATCANIEWESKAYKASLALSFNESEDEEMSFSLRLLNDCREVIQDKEITSTDLVSRLCALEESPWGHGDHRLNTNTLARNLKQYGIKPKQLNAKIRGYWKQDFEEPWSRYLIPLQAVNTVKVVKALEEELTPLTLVTHSGGNW